MYILLCYYVSTLVQSVVVVVVNLALCDRLRTSEVSMIKKKNYTLYENI